MTPTLIKWTRAHKVYFYLPTGKDFPMESKVHLAPSFQDKDLLGSLGLALVYCRVTPCIANAFQYSKEKNAKISETMGSTLNATHPKYVFIIILLYVWAHTRLHIIGYSRGSIYSCRWLAGWRWWRCHDLEKANFIALQNLKLIYRGR